VNAIAYLDTSAFLRLFLDEPDSELVARSVQETIQLFALRLMLTEARVTLERLRREGRLSLEDHAGLLDTVDLYWETQIQVLEMSEAVFTSAERAAVLQPGLRTLDALHLGAARVLRDENRPTPVALISCDHRLLRAAHAIGFNTPIPPPQP
jgi:predicted nucleic acid-binding protein